MGAFAVLVRLTWNSQKEEVHLVDSEKFIIGRGPECTLMVSDKQVSRKHLGVLINKGKIFLKDLNSGNGTYLEDQRLSVEDVHSYKAGSTIRLGESDLQIHFELYAKKLDKNGIPPELPFEDRETIENYLISARQHFEKVQQDAVMEGNFIIDEKKAEAEAVFNRTNAELEGVRNLKVSEANTILEAAKETESRILTDAKAQEQNILKAAKNEEMRLLNWAKDFETKTLNEIKEKEAQFLAKASAEAEIIKVEAKAFFNEVKSKVDKAMVESMEAAKQAGKEKADQIIAEGTKQIEDLRQSVEDEKKQFIDKMRTELENEKKRIHHDVLLEKEKWLAERQVRDQNLDSEYENKKTRFYAELANLEAQAHKLRDDNEKAQAQELAKTNDLQSRRREMESSTQSLQVQVRELETALQQKKFQVTELDRQFQQSKHEKERIEKKIDDMQSRMTENANLITEKLRDLDNIRLDIRKCQDDKIDAIRKINQELLVAKEQANQEAEKYKQAVLNEVDTFKVKEKENVILEVQKSLDHFSKQKEMFVTHVAHELEGIWLTENPDQQEKKDILHKRLKSSVQKAFDECYIELSKAGDKDVRAEMKAVTQKRSKTLRWLSATAMALVISTFVYNQYFTVNSSKSSDSAFETLTKEKLAQQAARKFNPNQDSNWKQSYTDNVVYTQGFVETQSNKELEEQWIRKLRDVFISELKLDEDVVARLVGVERSMISRLNEERKLIHPDFVDISLNKMREIEAESNSKMREILKSENNYSRFNQETKNFWEPNILSRAPAAISQ